MIQNTGEIDYKINQNIAFNIVKEKRKPFLKTFKLLILGFCLIELFTLEKLDPFNISTALLIIVPTLFPFYLWCSGKALGIPIFPFFCLTYLWAYGLPVLHESPSVFTYTNELIFDSSFTIFIFLLVATFFWFRKVKFYVSQEQNYRIFNEKNSNSLFFLCIVFALIFNIATLGGWFLFLTGGSFALIRGIVFALNTLAIFLLSYRCGNRELSPGEEQLFWFLLILSIVSNAASLVIIGSLTMFFLMIAGYTLGRKQVPWKLIVISFIFFSLLHYGKAEMRARYWFNNPIGVNFVQPWQYPAWYAEWLGYSFEYISESITNPITTVEKSESRASLVERTNLMYLLLMIQDKTPRDVPFLNGETYKVVPQLLIPRIFAPNKPASHETTYLLSIHYGRQTREATRRTTIGFGLLNEAYANFGIMGCIGLGVILGSLYGEVSYRTINAPILSFPSLLGIVFISVSIQSEFSSGVFVTYLFQSLVVLLLVRYFLMKPKIFSPNFNNLY